ncbi:translation initiation factor eIF-2B [Zooshikella harenae]|uniref:Translation initiation factor eIF-2B n=1 Tax=Zooshikella harenae TaxID=2827238 RepID=A0ABS5ZAA0_9GAMM|nr:hypothetical protein [Zooshikella harenae]MBU2710981.1 hypothetical protein [Zooshikella harenae]
MSLPTEDDLQQLNEQICQEISSNLTDGASQIARQTLMALADFCCLADRLPNKQHAQQTVSELVNRLKSIRPCMGAIAGLIECWQKRVTSMEDLREASSIALELVDCSHNAVQEAVELLQTLLPRSGCLLTHSYSSTVKELLSQLSRDNYRIICTESRPGNEGKRLAAYASVLGVPCTYITDAQVGIVIPKVHAVILGADCILADGSVVNKSGSFLLALAAKEYQKPVYVVCESFKRQAFTAEALTLEQHAPEELELPQLPGVDVMNQYFEVVPAEFITDIVTEKDLNLSDY